MSPTTYLITGASRGLGLGLVKTYISRPNNTVIAAVRGLSTATDLNSLPKGEGSTLILIAIDSSSPTSAQNAIDTLKTTHSIFQLDVVIANARISNSYSPLAKVPLSDVQEHMNVNGIGPLLLFQAVFPLLKKGSKFVGVSSAISSIGGMEMRPFPCGAYGMSKAVLNYVVRKVHFENEELVSFALDPGFVQTEMGNTGAKIFGMNQATTPIDECVVGMAKVIDEATREKTSGKFPIWEGGEFPW